jgi:serine/threonine protein kinase
VNALDGGHLVGRYRILSFLGAGAMGEVYLAEDPQIDRRLAIKTVRLVGRPQEIEDRKKRLLREARAAGRLLHPNVVTLFDAGEAEGLLYLAFEYVEGTDLAHRLEKGARLSLREALRAVRQAAEALDYAHSQGIVHRDIKPSNILLDRAGRVKVADFGIAKMAGQSTELTMAGSVMGSPQYLSPEQIRGEDLDGRSDIFSLGVVLYEILSGRRPFEGDTITTLVYQILHKEPPPVSKLRAVPPRVEELLRGMLAKGLDERTASAGVVAGELAAIESELSDETLSAPAGTGPLDATALLPRRTTGAQPLAASAAAALGTVPASPPTIPSVPPPSPTVAASMPTAAAALPVPGPMPAAPPPSYAPVPAATASPSRKLPVALVVAALLLMVLVGVAGAGYYGWQFWKAHFAAAAEQTAQTSQPSQPASVSPDAKIPPARSEVMPPPPAQSAQSPQSPQSPPPLSVAPSTAPPAQEPPRPVATGKVQPPSAPPTSRQPATPRVSPPLPVPAAPASRETPPVRAAPVPAAPSEEAAEEPEADQTLRSAMQVAFHVTPPDAHVLVEGRVIGEAQDWSGQHGARTYTFPGAGTYLVKIRKPGMKELRIAVEAGAGGLSAINAHLVPLAAAEVDSTDLQTVRVREGVSFNVRPALAQVEVDGQPVGPARRFAGGFLRPKEVLLLPPGKHRISLVLQGYRRKDFLVEVTETAEKPRDRIEWVLTPGGNE